MFSQNYQAGYTVPHHYISGLAAGLGVGALAEVTKRGLGLKKDKDGSGNYTQTSIPNVLM